MFASAPQAMITVIDKAGRKATLSRDWAGFGLAWAPGERDLVHGHRPGRMRRTSAPSRSRDASERCIAAPDWLVLHDISADGRVLLSRNTIRINLVCKRPADTRERDLTWYGRSFASASQQTARPWSSRMSWAPRPREPDHLSPTHGWFSSCRDWRGRRGDVVSRGEVGARVVWANLCLLPTGAGPMVTLPKGNCAGQGVSEAARGSATRNTLSSLATLLTAHPGLHSRDPGRSSSGDNTA